MLFGVLGLKIMIHTGKTYGQCSALHAALVRTPVLDASQPLHPRMTHSELSVLFMCRVQFNFYENTEIAQWINQPHYILMRGKIMHHVTRPQDYQWNPSLLPQSPLKTLELNRFHKHAWKTKDSNNPETTTRQTSSFKEFEPYYWFLLKLIQ